MPEPRELYRFAIVGLAAYGVTLLGDYSLKPTVFREKPVTALFFATAMPSSRPRATSVIRRRSQPEPRQTKGRRNGSTAIASASASAGLSRTASAR